MFALFRRYADWLHLRAPAGRVEPGPEVREDGSTAVAGLYIAGDLTGVPLLKLAADGGARVVRTIHADPGFARSRGGDVLDLAIIGGSVAGISAALEARKLGLSFSVLEAAEPFATIADFPARKPIFLYPSELEPSGLKLSASVKEALLDELREQSRDVPVRRARAERVVRRGELLEVELEGGERVRARRVIVAIGRSGNYRRLGVPGEELGNVFHRLHDPRDHAGRKVLVVGGGDSALETAVALAEAGATVTLSYRGTSFDRAKPANVERLRAARVDVQLATRVERIGESNVVLRDGRDRTLAVSSDAVFTMIGREPPLDFLRRSGVPIRGEWRASTRVAFALFLAFCVLLYMWKAGGAVTSAFAARGWFPFGVGDWLQGLSASARDASTLPGTLAITLEDPGFYYSLAYCACVALFGVARIRRRRTPYVRLQTAALLAVQLVPLFLLPYFVLPYLGHNGAFDGGAGKSVADALFPEAGHGHGREYWRSFGLILAWPLFIWNVFTEQPLWAWLAISCAQTFVVIPLIVWRWGKGAYCGWICSCGALAETLGDTQRAKMPHGPQWNRVNLVGQWVLAFALLIFALRLLSWVAPGSAFGGALASAARALQDQYYLYVDIGLAGIVGVGCYFWFSGRVWCRFACPLAALMHVYARFTQFRILPDKKKCISCNVCTSVCHQGIDVMSYAQRGVPMDDVECVRCSACVQSCPTGVLEFGRVDPATGRELARDERKAALPR